MRALFLSVFLLLLSCCSLKEGRELVMDNKNSLLGKEVQAKSWERLQNIIQSIINLNIIE